MWYILGGLLLGVVVVAVACAWWYVADTFKRNKKRGAALYRFMGDQER